MSDAKLNIYLAYSYFPHTTGVYFERALKRLGHAVHYVGIPHSDNFDWYRTPTSEIAARPGFPPNVDLTKLVEMGMGEPDLILYVDGPLAYFPRGLADVDAPTASYLIDVHRKLPLESAIAPFFDRVFICQRDFMPHFVEAVECAAVGWLPLACDPEIHRPLEVEHEFEVGFVGNVAGESERLRRLELLEKHFKMNDWRATRPKEEIAEVYSRSRVVFNASVGGDLNMRVFEALGCGATLITDKIQNGQDELFEDGTHLLEYSDDDEMLEKIHWCLAHEDDAREIARQGHELVLEKHTYDHRCEEIIDLTLSSGRQAPARTYPASRVHQSYARIYAMMRAVDPALDEVQTSWGKRGAIRVALEGLLAILKRINAITGTTVRIRKFFRRRSS